MLAVSDEIVDSLWDVSVRRHRPDLVAACGDLPADYLDYLVSTLNVPLVFVPGNHDPELATVGRSGLLLRAGMPVEQTGPSGINADRAVVDVAGLRIAGLGGSLRYRPGPNQYSQREFARRARRVVRQAARLRRRDGRGLDLLLTHAPPSGVGDGDDPPHQGFTALHTVVAKLRPRYLLHGHVHPYGAPAPDRLLDGTRVCNVVGYRVLDVPGA